MREPLMLLAALAATVAGLGWLALAMEVHWQQVCGARPLTPATVGGLRLLGAAGLLGSLGLCLSVDHVSMASLVWVMTLAGAALLIAFTLSWRPQWLALLLLRRPGRTGAG
ncbi:DUF3325 family protein [Paucibacter sp. M5-1]|uniref:DUF3325 family protein n=1 Tax=Paucibacter sp. M5-1 TaxID=3015998 RepID=UPI0022B888C4|nr:DUF3325 family protein [Paucibacter sp. M5-1]MCZ7883613.1 DUF3325 family protein [Paucibacter sp. M5-1]